MVLFLQYIKELVLCSLSFQIVCRNNYVSSNLLREMDQDFRSELDRPILIESVNAVRSQRVELPCDLSTKSRDDGVSMVLWFRDVDGEPLYSFDVRNKPLDMAKVWSSPSIFKGRAKFVAKTQPAYLVIDPVQTDDETIYRCRVDFRNSPTKNSKVNLTVVEPPNVPVIFDDKNRDRSKVSEPFNEGAEITLHCEVTGGKPKPRIDWYLEEKLLHGQTEYRWSSKVSVKKLTIPSLSRDYQNKKLTCHASNTNLILPATKMITLNINLKPLFVNITWKQEYLSANKPVDVECKCYGSKPPAHITWWLGSRQIFQTVKKSVTEGNMTDISTISFRPLVEDDGRYLTCRAENSFVENSAIEDKWRLNVQYSPILTLKIGSSLNADNIREGDDVYFECCIRANPKIHKFSWFHNNMEITSNISTNIIQTDHNLILQRIKKAASGNFTCIAANSEGSGESNPVILNIKYAPTCKTNGNEIYGALEMETISLKCDIDANPPAVEFHWTFNNSGDMKIVNQPNFITVRNSAVLDFTPKSESEFGAISCRARNAIGLQETACVFQMVVAGRPHPPSNCSMDKAILSRLRIECKENFDGGLPQYFFMEIWELNGMQPNFNITLKGPPPIFHVERVDPTVEYEIRLFSANKKGRSEPVILRTSPLEGVAKYTKPSPSWSIGSLAVMSLLLGFISLIFTCFATVVIYRRHENNCWYTKNQRTGPVDESVCHGTILISQEGITSDRREHHFSEDDADPDIISTARDCEAQKTSSKHTKPRRTKRSKRNPSEIYKQVRKNEDSIHCGEHFPHLDKDTLLATNAISMQTAQNVTTKLARNHKLGAEAITASHRMQESSI